MRKLFTLMLMSTTLGFANEDFASISSRMVPTEDLQQLQADRCKLHEEEQTIGSETNSLLDKQGQVVYYADPYYYSNQHMATFFSPDGRIVELEDESQWMILISDVARAAKWLTNDPVAIYPNKDVFWKTTNYKLTNLALDETIDVDLIRGPRLNSIYTKYVTGVDTFFDSIYLSDGSRWDVAWSDSALTRHWAPNDVVIIGDNYGWFSGSYPSILINVSLNQYVTAKRAY